MKFLSVLALLAFACSVRARADSRPSAEEIITNVIQRAEAADQQQERAAFEYQRTSRVDYLDERGAIKKEVVRLYQVSFLNGKPVARLLSINGQPPVEKDNRHRSAARETGDKSRSLKLSGDLLSRFQFTLRGAELFLDRPVWVLDFVPRPDAESDGFMDHLINAMSGTIWIDQQEYQMAKASLHLSQRVSFFGGLAGAIDQLNLQLVQKRVQPDVWLAEALTLDLAGRKLFSPIRLRCFENCSDFRKVIPPQASVNAASDPLN